MKLFALALSIALLPGCATLSDAEDALAAGASKYCELTHSDRLAVRKRFNFRIGKEGHCAVVQCEGDPPASCPFLSSDAATDPVFHGALTLTHHEPKYLCAYVDVALTPQMSVMLMRMGTLQFFSPESFSDFRAKYPVVMAGGDIVKTAMPDWYAVCVRQK